MLPIPSTPARFHIRSPLFWMGLAGILLCEFFLLAHYRSWLAPGLWQFIGRLVQANITPLAWLFYLVFLLGFLSALDRRSYLRRFRNRFLVCWLWSVPAWCYFDWMKILSKRPIPIVTSH